MGHPPTAWWDGPNKRYLDSRAYKELAKKLKLDIRRGSSIALLNALGAQGWELVSSTCMWNDNNGRVYKTWTLKRPK